MCSYTGLVASGTCVIPNTCISSVSQAPGTWELDAYFGVHIRAHACSECMPLRQASSSHALPRIHRVPRS